MENRLIGVFLGASVNGRCAHNGALRAAGGQGHSPGCASRGRWGGRLAQRRRESLKAVEIPKPHVASVLPASEAEMICESLIGPEPGLVPGSVPVILG